MEKEWFVMKPITPAPRPNFKAVVIAKDQPQYIPLPANVCAPYVETLWHLTLLERLTILLTGRVHLTIKTFGQPLQPLRLAVTRDKKI